VAAEAAAFRPAFGHLALLVQIPGVDVRARVEAEKGSTLTDREVAILDERTAAARRWLETYAPESARLTVHREGLPPAAAELTDDDRRFLEALAAAAEQKAPRSGEAWQNLIFQTAADTGMRNNRTAFAALYLAFLGRPDGPRAGWLLASLDPEFVLRRLREAAGSAVESAS
jgi:lysyl-tRNA synthetase class 1